MAKTSAEIEKEFIANIAEITGKSLSTWIETIKPIGLTQVKELMEWLKSQHALNHMQAQLLAGLVLNGGKPVYGDTQTLMDAQFAKSTHLLPLYTLLADRICTAFPGTQVVVKKTYLSFTAVREFAALNAKPTALRLGMDLGDHPFSEYLQKSKLTGPMPRISHMVEISSPEQINDDLLALLQMAYKRSH